MTRRVTRAWAVGPYVISQIEGHAFTGDLAGRPLFQVEIEGQGTSNELYTDLDEALAAGIARRWTGPRGAGGSGVGTAADWFLAMIGARPAPVLDSMVERPTVDGVLVAGEGQEVVMTRGGSHEMSMRGPASAHVRQATT